MSSHEKQGEQENAHPKTDSHPTQWVINEFLFWCRHPLVPFIFHVVTSLHPLQLRKSFFHLFHSFFSLGKSPNKKVIVLCMQTVVVDYLVLVIILDWLEFCRVYIDIQVHTYHYSHVAREPPLLAHLSYVPIYFGGAFPSPRFHVARTPLSVARETIVMLSIITCYQV